MARELAALNWNENVGKSKNFRIADFRKDIIDNFYCLKSNILKE
jgi:hypothetical protein